MKRTVLVKGSSKSHPLVESDILKDTKCSLHVENVSFQYAQQKCVENLREVRMHQCLSQFGSMKTLTRDEYTFPEVLSLQSFSELSYSINIYSTYSYRISFQN